MKLNADLNKRTVVYPGDYKWIPSPISGVERMMLDRIGDEVARATTIVRYAPNSEFTPHTHSGGEEFFVLDGVFADEHGEYPAGTYVRNPIGTAHTPKVGCDGATIFVKLYQFDKGDQEQKIVDTTKQKWQQNNIEGMKSIPLHHYKTENVALMRCASDITLPTYQYAGGAELFVLDGTLYDEYGQYPKGTWLRSPPLSEHHPFTKKDGATILIKTGHLLSLP